MHDIWTKWERSQFGCSRHVNSRVTVSTTDIFHDWCESCFHVLRLFFLFECLWLFYMDKWMKDEPCCKYVTVLETYNEMISELEQLYGIGNCLNNILSTLVDLHHEEFAVFCVTSYIAISDFQIMIENHDYGLSILSLNTQINNVKFDKLCPMGYCFLVQSFNKKPGMHATVIRDYDFIHLDSKHAKHSVLIIQSTQCTLRIRLSGRRLEIRINPVSIKVSGCERFDCMCIIFRLRTSDWLIRKWLISSKLFCDSWSR